MNIWLRLLGAIASGAFAALSFNENLWLLAIVSLILPIYEMNNLSRKYRMLYSLIFAQTWFLIHIHWMHVLGYDAWLALATLCALPWLLFGIVRIPGTGIRAVFIPTFAAITIEGIRSVIPWGGFPWGLLAYSQLDGPLVQLARVGGSSLVSGAVVACAASIVLRYRKRNLKYISIPIIFCAVGFAIPAVKTSDPISVAAIQGNVPRTGLDLSAQREAVFQNHVSETTKFLNQTSSSSKPKPDLIVWPESSTDIDPIPPGQVRTKIDELSKQAQVPLLVGAVTWSQSDSGPANAGILWLPEQGPVKQYAKNHLVPFGEYIPLRDFLTKHISRLQLVPVDYQPGATPGLFQVGDFLVGDVICFEVAYGKQIRETVALGAQIIAVQTNNATYGNTKQPDQQFAITRFRAIEHQRPFVIASTSGVSGLIDHNGNVIEKTEQFVAATVSGEVATVTEKSVTDRIPLWSALIGIIGFLTFCLLEFLPTKRSSSKSSNKID